jgi:nucleoside phosphorylase
MIDHLFLTPIVTEFAAFARVFRPGRRVLEDFRCHLAEVGRVKIAIVQSGIGRKRTRKSTRWAIERFDPRHVTIVGFAGGLVSGLGPGSLVVATDVVRPAKPPIACSPLVLGGVPLGNLLRGPGHRAGRVVESDHIVTAPAEKEELGQKTGAIAVDMESYSALTVCQEMQRPASVMRFISDTSQQVLPMETAQLMDEAGNPRPIRAAQLIAGRPKLFLELLAMERSTRQAVTEMKQCALAIRQALTSPPTDDD